VAELSKSKVTPPMLFYGKNLNPICFYVRNAIISNVLTKYLKNSTFEKKVAPPTLLYGKNLALFL
jgi:CheY-specific phosphatase CheX